MSKYLYSEKSVIIFADSNLALRLSLKIIIEEKVFVSGCYGHFYSGNVDLFPQASRYGELYVGIGSDATYLDYLDIYCEERV